MFWDQLPVVSTVVSRAEMAAQLAMALIELEHKYAAAKRCGWASEIVVAWPEHRYDTRVSKSPRSVTRVADDIDIFEIRDVSGPRDDHIDIRNLGSQRDRWLPVSWVLACLDVLATT